jgi:hypothetical protein
VDAKIDVRHFLNVLGELLQVRDGLPDASATKHKDGIVRVTL